MSHQPNPSLHANIWSRFFHSWISHLLHIDRQQKTLNLADLYDLLPQYQSNQLTGTLERNWLDEVKHHPDRPSLLRATIRTMRWKPLLIGLLLVPYIFFSITQPLLLTFLMDFFEPCSTMPIWQAWLFVIACVLTAVCNSLLIHYYFYRAQMLGLQMSIAYSGLIYRKVLRLSSHSLHNFGSGQITNLMANDASRISAAVQFFNVLWLAPLDIVIVTFLFWHFVKYITLIVLIVTLILLLFNSVYGRLYAFLQLRMLRTTDERIKIIAELLKSMRIVKMYCWETAFEDKIRSVRKREIFQLALRSLSDCLHAFLCSTYVSLNFLLIYGTIWMFAMPFDTRFFAVAYNLLNHTGAFVMDWFTEAIRNCAKYIVAEKRIQAFLLLEESQRDRRLLSGSSKELLSNANPTSFVTNNEQVHIEQVPVNKSSKVECHLRGAHWQQNASFSLNNIHFHAHPGDLICIIGPVGAGKSSLLQTLTGEIAFFDGKVRLRGSFCYVPQESWIFSSSVKKNILFGKEFDAQLFRRVVRATALDADFAQLSNGMNTIVGDQGVMLSGGQKARVNMARALYRDADIYLLDDPLSAVDVKVSKHLFERSIKNYLGDKICLLVTHQVQFLQDATRIIVLENGGMVETGTYEELFVSSKSFRHLLENIHQQQRDKQEHIMISSRTHSSKCISDIEVDDDEVISGSTLNIEVKQEGLVHWRVYIAYLRAGAGFMLSIFLIIFIFGIREATSVFYSWWLAEWSNDESYRNQQSSSYPQINKGVSTGKENYFNGAIGKFQSVSSVVMESKDDFLLMKIHYLHAGIGLALLFITFIHVIATKLMCLNAGRVLHNKMFQRLIRCPISFFDVNPVGRLLNRFTKDMVVVDDELPWTLINFLEYLFKVFGVIALVSFLNPWSLLPATIAVITMLFVRHRFAPCSRDLKRLESTARSPVYSYLTSTTHGLKVIRSYHAEKTCLSEFFAHTDDHTRATYLLMTTVRWAAIRFDWIALSFVVIVTSLAMIVHIMGRQFSAADIALTLSYSLTLTDVFQWTVRQSVEVETQMTSVERVLEYCELEQEPPAQVPPQYRPPSNWPSQGQITFNNVCMSHSKDPHALLALSHITLTILPHEKIGIVGRTGAGKSSFIQTLFRMGTLVDGEIHIDHIDISTVGLDDLRRRISIIPQDPVLFTGTMRSNLDQFGDYSDTEIWHALEQVQLKRLVSAVLANGLDSVVSESGSNLSVGQKQLVCLARAILKKSKILVIDEATANVDNATDELIQRSIRDQFRECTVLTVAHRLRTVIDSDRIMVLGNGELLEFDTPYALLSDENSQFSLLVDQAGVAEGEHLRILANGTRSYAQEDRKTVEYREASSEDVSETDPLVTSVDTVI